MQLSEIPFNFSSKIFKPWLSLEHIFLKFIHALNDLTNHRKPPINHLKAIF